MKTYKHPVTGEIRTPDEKNLVQIAALEKLGYVEWTASDVTNDPLLSVTYETVTDPHTPPAPPALPKLTTPVATEPIKTGGAITREDAEGTSKK